MPVRVRYLTDPACVESWAFEPVVRRLMAEFGDGLEWAFVMGGLAREYDASDGSGSAGQSRYEEWGLRPWLLSHWLEVAAGHGMPCDPLLWREAPIRSSYPACIAVKAAAEQAPNGAYAYLRSLREGLMCFRRKLDAPEALAEEARRTGLDPERFRVDLESNAILEKFAADLEEVRSVPDEARAAGAVVGEPPRERIAFPSLVFVGEDRVRAASYGWSRYEDVRAAALAAGARPAEGPRLDALGAVRRFGRMATAEVAAVCDMPEPPAAAELWRLHVGWQLGRVPVLCGELWEAA